MAPVVIPSPSQNSQQNTNRQYEGNSSTHKFHLISCRYAKEISSSNIASFKTLEEAIKQGYIPCKVCKP